LRYRGDVRRRLIGGPKLWPAISPGKTWSGSVAGVVAAVATVPLLNSLVLERQGTLSRSPRD
jgi:phosphatidate cytidylyltransferase